MDRQGEEQEAVPAVQEQEAAPVVQRIRLDQLQFEAMMAEITRTIRRDLNLANPANELPQVVEPNAGRPARGGRRGRGGHYGRGAALRARRGVPLEEEEPDGFSEDSGSDSPAGGAHRPHHRRLRDENNLGSLKLRIPPFSGKNDPDAYLEWEKKIESVFNCQTFSEEKKVKLASTEFNGYAVNWWEQAATLRRRNGEPPINSWFEMKTVMRKQFVPTHYGRDLHQKLRRLFQGSKSVEDYHQEMETLMIKADIEETMEATMARFLGGLNREIQDRLELQEYEDMDELLHKAILIEQQLKRKNNPRSSYGSSSKTPSHREDRPVYKPREGAPTTPTPNREDKGKSITSDTPNKSRNVKCFRCQGYGHYANECINKRVMVILDNGEVISEDEHLVDSEGEENVAYPVKGELLVTRRTLNVQPKVQEQRENLFHSRCLIQDKVCSLIIDGGSCTNVASQVLVDKLGLATYKHPRPYQLQWLTEEGEMRVEHQVKVPLSIGVYEDEIECDVLPMEASHILLGRPWQYDKRVMHDGYTNKHLFSHQGKQITLVPMTPQEVHQDQVKLK